MQPPSPYGSGFSLLRVRSPLLTKCMFVYFPSGTEMFYFPEYASRRKVEITRFYLVGFPHSDIFGSKVARHLPEAYRRHAASFIASMKPRHPPYALNFLLGNLKTAFCFLCPNLHQDTIFSSEKITYIASLIALHSTMNFAYYHSTRMIVDDLHIPCWDMQALSMHDYSSHINLT